MDLAILPHSQNSRVCIKYLQSSLRHSHYSCWRWQGFLLTGGQSVIRKICSELGLSSLRWILLIAVGHSGQTNIFLFSNFYFWYLIFGRFTSPFQFPFQKYRGSTSWLAPPSIAGTNCWGGQWSESKQRKWPHSTYIWHLRVKVKSPRPQAFRKSDLA
jgi:hypothetical protein